MTAATHTARMGDTREEFRVRLRDRHGYVDLTVATSVTFVLAAENGGAAIIEEPASLGALPGETFYKLTDPDYTLLAPGRFRVNWKVTWTDGVESFPKPGYDLVVIEPRT